MQVIAGNKRKQLIGRSPGPPVLPVNSCVEILRADDPDYDRTSSMQTGAAVVLHLLNSVRTENKLIPTSYVSLLAG